MMLTQRISVLAHDLAKQCHVAPVRVEEKVARQRKAMTDNCSGMHHIHCVCGVVCSIVPVT